MPPGQQPKLASAHAWKRGKLTSTTLPSKNNKLLLPIKEWRFCFVGSSSQEEGSGAIKNSRFIASSLFFCRTTSMGSDTGIPAQGIKRFFRIHANEQTRCFVRERRRRGMSNRLRLEFRPAPVRSSVRHLPASSFSYLPFTTLISPKPEKRRLKRHKHTKEETRLCMILQLPHSEEKEGSIIPFGRRELERERKKIETVGGAGKPFPDASRRPFSSS